MSRFFIFILLLASFASASNAYGKSADKNADNNGYKVESIGELKEATVSEAVRGALEPKGVRVIGEDGKAVCEVWFGKEIQLLRTTSPAPASDRSPKARSSG